MLWAQSATKDYIRAEHKLHSISKLVISQVIIPQSHGFWAYLYSAGTQHGNLQPAGWPILFCEPTQEPVLAIANAGKNQRGFGKNAGEWTGRVEIRKKFLAVSIAYMAVYWPTPGFKGRTFNFKFCVLTRRDFNRHCYNAIYTRRRWNRGIHFDSVNKNSTVFTKGVVKPLVIRIIKGCVSITVCGIQTFGYA